MGNGDGSIIGSKKAAKAGPEDAKRCIRPLETTTRAERDAASEATTPPRWPRRLSATSGPPRHQPATPWRVAPYRRTHEGCPVEKYQQQRRRRQRRDGSGDDSDDSGGGSGDSGDGSGDSSGGSGDRGADSGGDSIHRNTRNMRSEMHGRVLVGRTTAAAPPAAWAIRSRACSARPRCLPRESARAATRRRHDKVATRRRHRPCIDNETSGERRARKTRSKFTAEATKKTSGDEREKKKEKKEKRKKQRNKRERAIIDISSASRAVVKRTPQNVRIDGQDAGVTIFGLYLSSWYY